ncbi:MAG: hypothetical protein RRY33_08115 [Alistipes sp.]
MEGWIKIYRSILDWEWFGDSKMVHLFVYLLAKANFEDCRWRGIVVKRGQILTSLDTMVIETKLSKQTLRTCIARLKSTQEITHQTTHTYTLITISNYDDYQMQKDECNTEINTEVNTPSTRHQHAINTHNKNIRIKEDKNKDKEMGKIGNFANPDSADTEIPIKPKTEKEKDSAEKEKSEIPIKPPSANFVKFQQWILNNASQISKFKEPFTEAEFDRIKAEFDLSTIQSTLKSMHNWKPLLTKNISANLTFRKWVGRDKETGVKLSPKTNKERQKLLDRL